MALESSNATVLYGAIICRLAKAVGKDPEPLGVLRGA